MQSHMQSQLAFMHSTRCLTISCRCHEARSQADATVRAGSDAGKGGRRKKEEEGGIAAFIKNLQTLTWQVGKNHLYKHNKTTSLQNNISPNETPHKQTIVSSNICFQTKNAKSKTQ